MGDILIHHRVSIPSQRYSHISGGPPSPTWGRLKGALTADAVKKLHDRGIKVYCYTVDGKKGYESLARLGVDGITGDNFAFLKGR